MICPICASALTLEQQQCSSCMSDLTAFLTLAYQPDLLFNDAINRMKREDFGDACDLLCRASALRPNDTEIKQLWMRACCGAGDYKKAVVLMLDLMEMAPSETLSAQYEQLIYEYERNVSSPETLLRELLLRQSDRMEAIIERLERLAAPETIQATAPEAAPETTTEAALAARMEPTEKGEDNEPI